MEQLNTSLQAHSHDMDCLLKLPNCRSASVQHRLLPGCTCCYLINVCPEFSLLQHVLSLPLKFYAHWILQIMGLVIENTVGCSAWLNENFSKSKPPHSQHTKQPLLSKNMSVTLSKLTSSCNVFWSHDLIFKLLKGVWMHPSCLVVLWN